MKDFETVIKQLKETLSLLEKWQEDQDKEIAAMGSEAEKNK